jgi:zinc protease
VSSFAGKNPPLAKNPGQESLFMRRALPQFLSVLALGALGLSVLPTAQAENLPRPNMNLTLDDYQIDLRDFVFPSGLRILFQEDHTQPIVSITAVIDRGSADDPPGQEGIAHLVEHLWFRSLHGDLPKVWNVLHELGANLNASTASDWTNYMSVAPKDALVPLLRLEALRIGEPVLGVTAEDVATEREIVRNELRMRYENTDGSALWYLRPKLYPEGHPYHNLGIGTHESLNNITLEHVQEFTKNNYTPENTTIVVVGDFEIETIDENGEKVNNAWRYVQEAFPMELLVDPENPDGPFELGEPPVRVSGESAPPPEPADTSISYHKGGVTSPTLVLGWSLPGSYRPNTPLMQMTAGTWLTSAVLTYTRPDFDITRDELDDLKSIGCFLWDEEVNSAAICFIEMSDEDDPEEVREDALNGLYKMWDINQRPYQEYLFSASKMAQMAYTFRSVEIVSSIGNGRAAETANFTHFTGDPMYYSRSFEALAQVEAHDSAEFARTYLTRDRAVAVVIEPYDEGDITLDSSDAIYKGAVRQEATASMIDLDEVNTEMLEGMMSPPNRTEMREFTLDNGLDVVLLPYGTAPVVQVQMLFKGGVWYEPISGLDEYTNEWVRSDYTESPMRVAGSWTGGSGSTSQAMGATGSSGNLDALLYMTRNQLDSLYVNVDDRTTWLKYAKKSARGARGGVDWWANYVADSRLFPNHPISWRSNELYYETLKYGRGEMEAWLDTMYRPDNGVLFVVGRIDDPDAAQKAIETYFSGWDVGPKEMELAELKTELPDVPDRQVVVFDSEKSSQTQVTMFCQIGPASLENHEARQMLAAVLAEQSWVVLREQSGVTYGAGSGQSGSIDGSARLYFYSLVQNDAAALAVSTFTDLSDKMAAGDIDEDMLQLMKLNEARNYVLGHQTSGQMLNRLESPFTTGYGWDLIDGHAERLGAVTPADLQGQMERCNGHEIVTLTGPLEVIAPQLEEAGIAYEAFDWKAEKEAMFAQYDPKAYAKHKKKEAKEAAKAAKKGTPEDDSFVGTF